MTHSQIAREARPPEIEIPVRHSQIFILRLSINREGQCVGPIQNPQLIWDDFDITSGEIWIFRPRQTRSDSTRNFSYIFAPQGVRLPRKLRIFLRPKNHLRQPFAIAQVNENNAAVIARDIYPAGKRDLLADVGLAN